MADLIDSQLFINNKFVPASTGETFELFSPFDGKKVAKVAEASAEDVDSAVNAAQAAFPAWSALSPIERGLPLKKMAEKITTHKSDLADLEALSMGRPVDGYFDANYAAVHFNYFGEAAYAQGHTSLNTPGFLNMSLRQPFGVVGIIIPWNAPLVFFSKKVAPAVAAGNTVVLKSSEKAPLTSWKLAQWIEECGFPPGVINVVSGHGQVSGNAISAHMKIRAISFTGSTRTGRKIQIASANSNLKKVVFELGGKGPAVIFADADLEEAAKQTEFSINYNSGQTCMANSRIYVQESAKEKFTEVFKKFASQRKIGNPRESGINHGPQADKVQYDTVLKYIALGKELGQVSLDGEANSENLTVHPVIFNDAPEDHAIMKEEIFGPVVVINTFSSEEEVIAKANDTEFGLYASLWTKDLERALRVSKKLESGMIGVNCASPTGCWDLPFGGWKQSGTGRESLLESMEHFTEQKSIYFKVRGIGG
ncbi:ALDH-like protein [Glarea lozoyensis ATCC 20868]|uniref:aldehyde dehydrogenase (NAD(+)) n=1 Tax=Glarea lozoyensis (strain ATCC 20868 / MF5171) TaxID=1116229 RepID=S3DH98_GLAL2|nr:ALDH-like protein [Glarea lozoyensis ATCC 20868]EPE36534.1 ALDH-like protein [Glarea lozoyensis ATCC 20868]